jgi:hypothetical protein
MAGPSFSPNGNTVALSVTVASSSAQVPALSPINKIYAANSGANPVQLRFYVNTSTGTATFPTVGSPSLGPVLNAGDAQVFEIPNALVPTIGIGGFTTTVTVAAIALTGTNAVYLTPVV